MQTLTSQQSPHEDGKPWWTVMVFMSAQNVPGEAAPLIAEAKRISPRWKRSAPTTTSTSSISSTEKVYQNDAMSEKEPIKEPVPDGLRDNNSGQALIEFIKWALGLASHKPSDYSLLVLGSRSPLRFRPAVTKSGIDAMDFEDVPSIQDRSTSVSSLIRNRFEAKAGHRRLRRVRSRHSGDGNATA